MFSHLSRFCKDVLPSKRYDPTKEKTPKSSNSKRLLLKAWFPHHRYNHYDLEKNVQRSYEKPATAIAATIWKPVITTIAQLMFEVTSIVTLGTLRYIDSN